MARLGTSPIGFIEDRPIWSSFVATVMSALLSLSPPLPACAAAVCARAGPWLDRRFRVRRWARARQTVTHREPDQRVVERRSIRVFFGQAGTRRDGRLHRNVWVIGIDKYPATRAWSADLGVRPVSLVRHILQCREIDRMGRLRYRPPYHGRPLPAPPGPDVQTVRIVLPLQGWRSCHTAC